MRLTICLFMALFIGTVAQAQDWPNLGRFKDANEKLQAEGADPARVVFMGNSITENWIRFHPQFFNGSYVNRGISGQTTPQMLIRFRPDVINLNPSAVVIFAGTNDIAGNTGPSTLEMIMDNIKSMADIANNNGIKVLLCSVLPAFDYPWKPGLEPAPKIAALNEMIEAYAKEKKFTYVDFYSPMVDSRKGLKSEYTEDGVHPNPDGYDVMEPIIDKQIKKALKR